MLCDVCNVTVDVTAQRVSALMFRKLLDRGFGINETNLQMMLQQGVPRHEAIAFLVDAYRASESDWLLCDSCFAKAQSNLTS